MNECPLSNQSAVDCLRSGAYFYDACTGHCEREMSFLRLSKYLQLEHFVYGYLFPVLVLLVVVANVLVALVLSQRHMLSPTNLVLKYMAIADLCVGLFPLPWNFYYHTLRHFEREQEELELWWCYAYKYSMDAIPPVCHNIAMWLTVLLAGQRYLCIRYPLNSRQICSIRNVRIATVCITCISIICGLPKCVDYHFAVYEGLLYVDSGEWVPLRSCLSGFTFFVQLVGQNAFFNAYFWTRVVAFILLPSLLLICLNALLIQLIRKAQRRKERLLREKRAREAERQTDSNSTSIMLVIIVSIFLIVNLPTALFMAMLCVYNTLGLSNRFLEGVFPVTFLLVNNMLVMATYPINFGIYCFMSSSFRDTFWMLFCRRKSCAEGDRIDSKRMPSLGGGGVSEMNNNNNSTATSALSTVLRRSTDPSVDKQHKTPLANHFGQSPRPQSIGSAFSLLSEPLLGPPPQLNAIPPTNGPAKMRKSEPAKRTEEQRNIWEGGENGKGGKKCKAISPTETIIGETIFL
ncbi:hypothetical protein niasHS_007389 [Heterodera schachtii]|uniref:G-protein coupled receptors family 1 profile domain-containing protein n=1 Tax=Heterodera schachtii TaxID=97005 RepID=A0ABD2JXN5_HETSC